MSKQNDWMRNDRWDEEDQRAFFQRLGRSRSTFNRVQYLHIKAAFLAKAEEPTKQDAAVELEFQSCREAEDEAMKFALGTPKHKQYVRWAMNAQVHIAKIRQRQGRPDDAIAHYRDALRRQQGEPPDPYITGLARAVYETNRVAEFRELLDLLNSSWRAHQKALGVFRHQFFEYALYQAVLSFAIGRIEAAKAYARSARSILAAEDHGIGQNRSVGTVHATAEQCADLQRILDMPLSEAKTNGEGIIDFLSRVPPGTRTRQDVDQQIREERDGWDDR